MANCELKTGPANKTDVNVSTKEKISVAKLKAMDYEKIGGGNKITSIGMLKQIDEQKIKENRSLFEKITDWAMGKWNRFKNSGFVKTLKSWWKKLTKCPGDTVDLSYSFDDSNPCIPNIKDIMSNIMKGIFDKLPMKKFFDGIATINKKLKKAIAFFGTLNAFRGFTFKNFVGSFLKSSGLKNIAGQLGLSSMLDKAFNSHKGLNFSSFKDYFGFNSELKKIKDSWNNYKDEFKNPIKGIAKGIEDLGKGEKWSKLADSVGEAIGISGVDDKGNELLSKFDNVKKLDDGTLVSTKNGLTHTELPDGTNVDVTDTSVATTLADGDKVENNLMTGEVKTTMKDGTIVDTKNGVTTTTMSDGTKIVGNVITKPNGEIEIVPENGSVTLDDGTVVNGNGDIVKSDGTIIKSNGDIVKSDGTIVKSDGTKILPDGTKILPDGTIIKPNGTIIKSDGTIVTNQNVTDLASGVVENSGTIVNIDGSVVSSSTSDTNGTIVTKAFAVSDGEEIKEKTEIKIDDYSLVVSVDDGSTITLKNGVVNSVNNDKIKSVLPDGTTVEVEDGKVKIITPDGMEIKDFNLVKNIEGMSLTPNGDVILPDGSLIDKNGNLMLPDGTIIKSNGNKFLPNGDIVLSSGLVIKKDGSIIDGNGNNITDDVDVLADGTKILPDGTKIMPDGTVILADGSKILPDGSKIITNSEGTLKILSDGSKILPNGVKVLADGIQILTNGTIVYPNGVVKDADGNIISIPDGATLLADGSVVDSDGNKILPDGIKVKPDGTKIYPSGVSITPDGNVIMPDGNVIVKGAIKEAEGGIKVLPDGSVILLNGNIVDKSAIKKTDDGKIVLPDGSVIFNDGKVIKPLTNKTNTENILEVGGEITLPDGTKVLSDGTKVLSDGTKVLVDGTKILTNGTKIMPDGTKIFPDGTKILSDGSVVNDNNKVEGSNVSVNVDSGEIKDNNGNIVKSDGTKVLSDGTQILNNGDKVLSNGLCVSGNKIKNAEILKPISIPGGKQTIDGTKVFNDGSKLLADGTKILEDGTKILSNGIKVNTNGDKILSNGFVVSGAYIITTNGEKIKISEYNADGVEKLENGIKFSDGIIVLNDGSIVVDGKVIDVNGNIQTNNGIIDNNGNIVLNNGIKLTNNGYDYNGVKISFNGDKTLPDGTKVSADGKVVLSNGTTIVNGVVDGELPDGVTIDDEGNISVGGYIIKSDGSVVTPIGDVVTDTTIKKSDGKVLSVDGSVIANSYVKKSNGDIVFNDGTRITNDGYIIYINGIKYKNKVYYIGNIKVDYNNFYVYIGDDYIYKMNENVFCVGSDTEIDLNDGGDDLPYGYFKDGCYYLNSDVKICEGKFYYKNEFEVSNENITLFNKVKYDINGNKIIKNVIFSYSENGLLKKVDILNCKSNEIYIDTYGFKVYLNKGYYEKDGNEYTDDFSDEYIEINLFDKFVYDIDYGVKLNNLCEFYFDDGEKIDKDGNWYLTNGSVVKNNGIVELPNSIKIVSGNVIIKNENVVYNGEVLDKTKLSASVKDENEKLILTDSYIIFGKFMYDRIKKLVIDKTNKIVYDVVNKTYYIGDYYIKDGLVRNKYNDMVVEKEGYELFKNNYVHKKDDDILFTNGYIKDNVFYDFYYNFKVDINSGDVYLSNVNKGNFKENPVKIGDTFAVVDGVVFTNRYVLDLINVNEIFYNYHSYEIVEKGIDVKLDSVYHDGEYIGSLYLNNYFEIDGGVLYRNLYYITDEFDLYYRNYKIGNFGNKFIISADKNKVFKNYVLNLDNAIQYKNYVYSKYNSVVTDNKKIFESYDNAEIILNPFELVLKNDNFYYSIINDEANIGNDLIIKSNGDVYSDEIKQENGALVIKNDVNIYDFGVVKIDDMYFDKYSKFNDINGVEYDNEKFELTIDKFKFNFYGGLLEYDYFDIEVLKYYMVKNVKLVECSINSEEYYFDYQVSGNYLSIGGSVLDMSGYNNIYYYNNENRYILFENDDEVVVYKMEIADGMYSLSVVDESDIYNEMINSDKYFKLNEKGVFYNENKGIGIINYITSFDNKCIYLKNKGFNENEINKCLLNNVKHEKFEGLEYYIDSANDYFELKLDEYKIKFDNNLLETKVFKNDGFVVKLGMNNGLKKIEDGVYLVNGFLIIKNYIIGNFMIIKEEDIYYVSKNYFGENIDSGILTNLILESS